MDKADTAGSGWVSVCNTNHYGIAGYYTIKALERDMIGWSMTSTTKIVAPCFGRERMLGTNPISISFPGGEEPPVVVDLATSVAAYGKVEEAARMGVDVPSGWCLDASGAATVSTAAMMDGGALLTLGSDRQRGAHKGYCLSAAVDILCCVLSGARWGPHAPPFALRHGVNAASEAQEAESAKVGKGIGHFFGAMRIDGFRDVDEFKGQMDNWSRTFRATAPVDPQQPVLIPGDPERSAEAVRSVQGVPVKRAVMNDIKDICQQTGLVF